MATLKVIYAANQWDEYADFGTSYGCKVLRNGDLQVYAKVLPSRDKIELARYRIWIYYYISDPQLVDERERRDRR